MTRGIVLLAAAIALSACASGGSIGSVAGGNCQLTKPALYVVLGKTDYDQDWIDRTTEGLTAGCNWQRPQERPAELDAPRAHPKPAEVTKAAPAPKRRFWQRRGAPVAAVPRPRPPVAEPGVVAPVKSATPPAPDPNPYLAVPVQAQDEAPKPVVEQDPRRRLLRGRQ